MKYLVVIALFFGANTLKAEDFYRMHEAAANGDLKTIATLYVNDCKQLLKEDKQQRIPMHLAAANNQIEAMVMLLYLGIKGKEFDTMLSAKDKWGKTARDYAVGNYHNKARALIDRAKKWHARQNESLNIPEEQPSSFIVFLGLIFKAIYYTHGSLI